jgi:transcriptional regulator with XRE-family HTH domain
MSTRDDGWSGKQGDPPYAELIIERLKTAIDLVTDADLAAALGVSRTTLSNWRSRNSVPLSRIRDACKNYAVPIDYILTGNILRASQPLLDVELVGYLFRVLARFGFLSLPEPFEPGHDPALRAAAEFAVLHRDTRVLFDQLTTEGEMSREEATLKLVTRLANPPEGPQ